MGNQKSRMDGGHGQPVQPQHSSGPAAGMAHPARSDPATVSRQAYNTQSSSSQNTSSSEPNRVASGRSETRPTGQGSSLARPAQTPTASVPRPMPARKAALEDFVLLKTVGKGSFGKVVMVKKKDDSEDKVYAMKILKKEMVIKRKQYEHTLSERRILENIDHPFIVSLRFAFQSEHKLYMIFDFFNGGELYHYLSEGGRFGEERARFYAAEITSALDYMHARGIVYRDLKPENLILDSAGHLRITDFGLSKENVVGDSITSICGTPEYLAPEILRKRPYGAAVDWWSLGTLLFEMIAGLPPFYDRNRQAMYRKILEAPLEPPDFMSPEAADICARLLIREPTARLGYNGAQEIKAHPFFRSIDWDALDRRDVRPPWVPDVKGPTDTSNIASEFTTEPAGVTPSPAQSRLKEVMREAGHGADDPPSFKEFTFTAPSVLGLPDGSTYRVSFAEDEEHELTLHDMVPATGSAATPAGNRAGFAAGGGKGGPRDLDDGGGGTPSAPTGRAGSDHDGDHGVMGQMEGLRIS